jgi:AmiR/NasT family two-component response regulator
VSTEERVRRLGVVAYVVKPLDIPRFLALLDPALRAGDSAEQPE